MESARLAEAFLTQHRVPFAKLPLSLLVRLFGSGGWIFPKPHRVFRTKRCVATVPILHPKNVSIGDVKSHRAQCVANTFLGTKNKKLDRADGLRGVQSMRSSASAMPTD